MLLRVPFSNFEEAEAEGQTLLGLNLPVKSVTSMVTQQNNATTGLIAPVQMIIQINPLIFLHMLLRLICYPIQIGMLIAELPII